MQIMPATAAGCGLHDPFDPRGNLECGAAYLAQMLARFNGNVPFAVAAYNAGPSAVIHDHGIPPQTQLYVQRVLAIYQGAGTAPAPKH
jgi:soluble lytic murein transglycosylase-like protein